MAKDDVEARALHTEGVVDPDLTSDDPRKQRAARERDDIRALLVERDGYRTRVAGGGDDAEQAGRDLAAVERALTDRGYSVAEEPQIEPAEQTGPKTAADERKSAAAAGQQPRDHVKGRGQGPKQTA